MHNNESAAQLDSNGCTTRVCSSFILTPRKPDRKSRRPAAYTEHDEDSFERWSEDGSDSEGSNSHEEALFSDDLDYDEFGDDDGWGTPLPTPRGSISGGKSKGRMRGAPRSSFSDFDLDGDEESDDGIGRSSGDRGSYQEPLWSDDGEDSWDADVASMGKSVSGRGEQRPRPSAWTGDGGVSGSRRGRSSGRGSPLGRAGPRGSMGRYQRGRPTKQGFAVRMPTVNGAAIASALRRQMGTARDAVGTAGTLAASTSKKLKREVGQGVV